MNEFAFRRAPLLLAVAAALLPGPATAQGGGLGEWPESMRREAASTPWHQEVAYRLEATLDEDAEALRGRGRITYVNHSPDTLAEFYFHQYLNAFRPNSAWARWELRFGERRFQDLGAEEHGFERFREVRVNGAPATPSYPFAPDSTIARIELPSRLPPGDSLELYVTWEARPSTLPRRQGRRGRHYDFAQWYPRVVVYDLEGWRAQPLYPAGEFYGEFATYDVTLEVLDDQVIGATGVPVAGDPGWEGAAVPGTGPVRHQRDWYGGTVTRCVREDGERVCGAFPPDRAVPEPGDLRQPTRGWKRVRFYAEDVHHFAWSASPDYLYESGEWQDVAIHVLYRPGDEESWGGGTVVVRTATALEWFDDVWGDYAYPQITNLHRIEPGGTEFPMLIMDGRADLGLILHEVGHVYAHGILANNEWYEGWLDEGLSSFTTAWYFEEHGGGREVWETSEAAVLGMEVRGETWPVVHLSQEYPDYPTYSRMIYTKGSLIFRMLRDLAGEEDFRRILRTYYERYRLKHVDSEAFQAVVEEVLREDMDWFFGQWLHATGVVDYALSDVEVREVRRGEGEGEGAGAGAIAGDGEPEAWISRFTVEKVGDLRMPVPVRITGEGGRVFETLLRGRAARDPIVLRTDFEPRTIDLDPDGEILDWNTLNDSWEAGWLRPPAPRFLSGGTGVDLSFLSPFDGLASSPRTLEAGWYPTVWANEPGGWNLGVLVRTDYNGFHRSILQASFVEAEIGDRGRGTDVGLRSLYYRVEDPIVGERPWLGSTVEAMGGEGRLFVKGTHAFTPGDAGRLGPPAGLRVFGSVAGVYDESYLRPGRWSPGEDVTGELGAGWRDGLGVAGGSVGWDVSGSAGIDSRAHRYVRGEMEVTGTWDVGSWSLRPRAFLGGVTGINPGDGDDWDGSFVPLERRFFLDGGGPYHALCSPYSRSRDALLDEEGVIPGGAGLRGFSRRLPVEWVGSVNVDLVSAPVTVAGIELRGAAFADAAVAREIVESPPLAGPEEDRPLGQPPFRQIDETTAYWDLGVGVELGREGSPIRVRLDVPFLVSDAALANGSRDDDLGFRLAVGFRGY